MMEVLERMMTLSREDGALFYQLFLPLLDYVIGNDQAGRAPDLFGEAGTISPARRKSAADTLWSDTSIIDDYLEEKEDLPEEHRAILRSWKRRVRGTFVMERHLKDGSIFISLGGESVYQVKGIQSSWEEMFAGVRMPLVLDATLLPFKDVIISDGLVMTSNIVFTGELKQMCRELYLSAKKNGQIQKSLRPCADEERMIMEEDDEGARPGINWGSYEKRCHEIREENRRYLQIFAEDMDRLSPKTVRTHLGNVDLFINEYLLREDAVPMEEGIEHIGGFLGDFFIRKCLWTTPATIKSASVSIRKFYKSMMEHGFVKKEAYAELCSVIKEDLEGWQEDCAAYNDPEEEDPFGFWFEEDWED